MLGRKKLEGTGNCKLKASREVQTCSAGFGSSLADSAGLSGWLSDLLPFFLGLSDSSEETSFAKHLLAVFPGMAGEPLMTARRGNLGWSLAATYM